MVGRAGREAGGNSGPDPLEGGDTVAGAWAMISGWVIFREVPASFLSLSFQETMGILGGSELSTERRGAYKRKERKREGTSLL